AWPPAVAISAATSASLAWLRAARATVAPWRASSSATARPIPCDAPVTSAMRPCKLLMFRRFPLCFCPKDNYRHRAAAQTPGCVHSSPTNRVLARTVSHKLPFILVNHVSGFVGLDLPDADSI